LGLQARGPNPGTLFQFSIIYIYIIISIAGALGLRIIQVIGFANNGRMGR